MSEQKLGNLVIWGAGAVCGLALIAGVLAVVLMK
jgi:hypothetical protein